MLDRRGFLFRSLAAGLGGGGFLTACGLGGGSDRGGAAFAEDAGSEEGAGQGAGSRGGSPEDLSTWEGVRAQFRLDPELVHMSALVLASHPRPVREAIARHRRELDGAPTAALEELRAEGTSRAREAAASHLGARPEEIVLTRSTTEGLALVYHGLHLEPGEEVLTTEHDHYATHGSLRLAAERAGASVRKIPLYERPENVTADEMVSRIAAALRPETRVLALTWVHSDTGTKLPMERVAAVVEEANAERGEEDRILVGLDGVHGLGVARARVEDFGCDFFVAGCHKWLFGPRGTGIVWARPGAWARCTPLVPSFLDQESWDAWGLGEYPPRPTTAASMTPGGFHAFEHRWAVADAFDFHERVGPERVERRVAELAGRLASGLADMEHVRLVTPSDGRLSAGIVAFDVEGMSSDAAVLRLREAEVVATTSPYRSNHARLSPSIYNTDEEVERALRAVRALRG